MAHESRALIEQRVQDVLDLPLELPEVEFKRGGPFDPLKFRIAKTSMGMANRRDGGLIVVGVSQDPQRRFILDGVSQESADTFVQETVSEFVAKYSSPVVDLKIAQIVHLDKVYVAIAVSPFSQTPVVCSQNTPHEMIGTKNEMRIGDFYVRLNDPVRTNRVTSAEMLQDLLQLAAGRRAAEMIRTLREGGVNLEGLTKPSRFDAEVQDIDDIF